MMNNSSRPNKPDLVAQARPSADSVIDVVTRRAIQFNPALSKVPQLGEVQSGFAELAGLQSALPAMAAPDPTLTQARQAIAQARANFGQRVETQLYQALYKEMKKLQDYGTWGMVFGSFLVPWIMQYYWAKTRQRLPRVYQPVAEFLASQGRPKMKTQVQDCLKDLEKAMGINTTTMQQSAAAASHNAAVLAQAQQSEVQAMNEINQKRVQSFERSSAAFDSYLRG